MVCSGDGAARSSDGRVNEERVEMLDRANSGPEPCAEILRAIRHGAAAGACSVAARETGSAYWAAQAADQREKATTLLHQAASGAEQFERSSSRAADAFSNRATVTPEVPARSLPMTLPSSKISRDR